MAEAQDPKGKPASMPLIAPLSLWLAIAVGVITLLAGPGYRFHLLTLGSAFLGVTIGAFGGIVTGLISIAAIYLARPSTGRPGQRMAVLGLAISIITAGVPWTLYFGAHSVPRIHDITTDTQNPPQFHALLAIREKSPNGAAYGGPAVAAQQLKAYPDIKPVFLAAPPETALNKAVETAKSLGWKIAKISPDRGILEATDTTFWFGFKDDIIVRVSSTADGSRIDVRSVSRVGISDIGANARRIREFLRQVK